MEIGKKELAIGILGAMVILMFIAMFAEYIWQIDNCYNTIENASTSIQLRCGYK